MTIADATHRFWRTRFGSALLDWFVMYGPWLQVAMLLVCMPFEILAAAYHERQERRIVPAVGIGADGKVREFRVILR